MLSAEIAKQNRRRIAIERLKGAREKAWQVTRRPVETPEGVFESLHDAARYHRLPFTTATYRVRTGEWRYVTI